MQFPRPYLPGCSGMGMWVWPLIGALTALLVPFPSPDGQSPRTRVFFFAREETTRPFYRPLHSVTRAPSPDTYEPSHRFPIPTF